MSILFAYFLLLNSEKDYNMPTRTKSTFEIKVTVLGYDMPETHVFTGHNLKELYRTSMKKVSDKHFIRSETRNLDTGEVLKVTTLHDVKMALLEAYKAVGGFNQEQAEKFFEQVCKYDNESLLMLSSATNEEHLYAARMSISQYAKTKSIACVAAVKTCWEVLQSRGVRDKEIETFIEENNEEEIILKKLKRKK